MTYPMPSQEVIDEIDAMFQGDAYLADYRFSFHVKDDGYHITASQMYNYVPFPGLSGMSKIAGLLDCDEGDEVSKRYQSGCETCDYGSTYEITWRFWRKEAAS